jgi:hypothetical protein
LRLGRWFVVLRQSSQPYFDVTNTSEALQAEARASRRYFVPFGLEFVLHPGRSVLPHAKAASHPKRDCGRIGRISAREKIRE